MEGLLFTYIGIQLSNAQKSDLKLITYSVGLKNSDKLQLIIN